MGKAVMIFAIAAVLAACSETVPPRTETGLPTDSSAAMDASSIAAPEASASPSVDPYLVQATGDGMRGVPEGVYPAKGRPVPDNIEKREWEAGMAEAKLRDEQLQGITPDGDPVPLQASRPTAEPQAVE